MNPAMWLGCKYTPHLKVSIYRLFSLLGGDARPSDRVSISSARLWLGISESCQVFSRNHFFFLYVQPNIGETVLWDRITGLRVAVISSLRLTLSSLRLVLTCRLVVEYGSPGEVRLRPANRPARSAEAFAAAQLRIAAGEHRRLLSEALFLPGECWHDFNLSSPQISPSSSSACRLHSQKVPLVLAKERSTRRTQRYFLMLQISGDHICFVVMNLFLDVLKASRKPSEKLTLS